MMIIGLVGFIHSGKDTVAGILDKNHGFSKLAFADTLKDITSVMFGWDREMLEGRTPESRVLREEMDDWWSYRLDMKITPRWTLQNLGTEVMRKHFHDDIWIACLERKLEEKRKWKAKGVSISDVRFPNEIKAIRNHGGTIVRIKRGEDPPWFYEAMECNLVGTYDFNKQSGIHESETAWIGQTFDYTINNNGTIEDLEKEIASILTHVKGE